MLFFIFFKSLFRDFFISSSAEHNGRFNPKQKVYLAIYSIEKPFLVFCSLWQKNLLSLRRSWTIFPKRNWKNWSLQKPQSLHFYQEMIWMKEKWVKETVSPNIAYRTHICLLSGTGCSRFDLDLTGFNHFWFLFSRMRSGHLVCCFHMSFV